MSTKTNCKVNGILPTSFNHLEGMFSHQIYIKGFVLWVLYPLIREPEINQSYMSMYVVE